MAKKEQQTETANVDVTEESQTETTVEPVQLTIQDLQGLATIVDLASNRGAFKTNEFTTVGNVYNKLSNFLAYVKAQAEAAEAAAEDETSEVE